MRKEVRLHRENKSQQDLLEVKFTIRLCFAYNPSHGTGMSLTKFSHLSIAISINNNTIEYLNLINMLVFLLHHSFPVINQL